MKLGDKLRDTISGLTGIAVSRVDHLNGCVRFAIQPQELHEGKPIEAYWVDDIQLEVIEEKPSIIKRALAAVGGDRTNPPARSSHP